ncbi:MAG: OmpA family protein, partial [Alphaproteobacteria bacterium]|nr:OmpA family protein [Alphaproteobacteria bacterium]
MRCNPWRWLWGLIPIVMLSWIAYQLQRPVIEADLTSRAQRVLEEAGFDWARVQFTGRDAIVIGKAPDEGTPRKAIQAVRSIWGVRIVRARTDLIDRVSDYSWSASVRNGRVIANGHVPNSESRQSILRVIKTNFPKFEVDDDMRLARGAVEPAKWLSQIGFALKQLRLLKRGRALLTERELRVTGEALDFTSYKTLASQLSGTLPHGLMRATNSVTPPAVDPFTWEASLNEQQLLLDGHVPKDQLREELFAEAKRAFPKLAIVDRMKTARGAPRNWGRVAFMALQQLARMTTGRAELVARDLTFIGQAKNETSANEIQSVLRAGLPETYKLVENIT